MIDYRQHPPGGDNATISCYFGAVKLGEIYQEVDNTYHFMPLSWVRSGSLSESMVKDLANKLASLNATSLNAR